MRNRAFISIILFVCSLSPFSALDINSQGKDIIVQHDIETILVTTDLSPTRGQLDEITKGLKVVKQNLISDVRNTLIKEQKAVNRAILNSIRTDESSVKFFSKQMDTLLTEKARNNRDKRALEILGSFLSTMTGVPSARDHRKVLEQIKAIKFENRGLETLMSNLNNQNRELLSRFHTHDTEITQVVTKVNELVNISSNFASHLHKAFSLISVNSKVMNAFYTISFTISMAKDIIGKGDEGRLSRNAIPVHELRTIIDKIHLKRQTDGPVFDRENCHMYYEMKLAHSWADQANFKLYTLLQIPIASLKDVQTLHILDNKNKIGSDLTMAVINRQSNCYRLLSASDYLECTTLNSAKLCQKRLIQINPRLGCSLRLMNCEAWTTDVVHDLSNSEVFILLRQNMNASLECDNAQKNQLASQGKL